MKLKGFAVLCLILFLSTNSYADSFKIALFSPKADSPFWTMVSNFAKEAAADLGMDLRIYDAELSQYRMREQVIDAVSGADKVDAVVVSNFKQLAPQLFEIAERAQVSVLLFNSGLTKRQQSEIGPPRTKYKFWIGEILPDNRSSSAAVAKLLVSAARQHKATDPDGKVQMVGLSGIAADGTSIYRVAGLKEAVAARNDVVLKQVVFTDYSAREGERKFRGLIKRYPGTTAVWSASYRITDGILKAMRGLGMTPGKNIFTNSFVLNENALEKVKSGELVATVGGHCIEGAWVMVLLYDYLSGVDFAAEGLEMRTPMGIATKENVDLYLSRISTQKFTPENLKKIDFTRYSRKMNPEIKQYDFNFESILEQF